MKRLLKLTRTIALVAVLLLTVAQVAYAASPHFIRADARLQGNNLLVTWKEAGLDDSNTNYTVSAFASATYVCRNNGGHVPSDPKKTNVSSTVQVQVTFDPKNGSVNGSALLSAPAPIGFSCPSGQRIELESVSYTAVQVHDDTNGITIGVPGVFSAS